MGAYVLAKRRLVSKRWVAKRLFGPNVQKEVDSCFADLMGVETGVTITGGRFEQVPG